MGDDIKLHKQKLHGLNLKKADLEAGLMHAEREAAMWRQAHATLEADSARMRNEVSINIIETGIVSKRVCERNIIATNTPLFTTLL